MSVCYTCTYHECLHIFLEMNQLLTWTCFLGRGAQKPYVAPQEPLWFLENNKHNAANIMHGAANISCGASKILSGDDYLQGVGAKSNQDYFFYKVNCAISLVGIVQLRLRGRSLPMSMIIKARSVIDFQLYFPINIVYII